MSEHKERTAFLANEISKRQLLARSRSYIEAEAKRKDVEPWVIVGHIFGVGSGVALALWSGHISGQEEHEQ